MKSASTPLVVITILIACAGDAIEWREPVSLPSRLAASSEIGFDEQGQLIAVAPPAVSQPVFTGQCAGSVRVSHDTTGDWIAAWWAVRPDSTAEVVISRSGDGVTWSAPIRVDSTDVGRIGCQRPPPSIRADGANVHVAYAMAAPEGPGIFAAHSMDRGLTFHTPVAVVYGATRGSPGRGGHTSIAALGDLVVVAYEDPNTTPQRVGVALSRTAGHTFEHRETVTPPTGEAEMPAVALRDGRVAVTWVVGSPNAPTDASASRFVRIGVVR